MNVFVLCYRHRHGEDVMVYASESGATRAAASIAMEYLHEVAPEDRRRITEPFASERWWDVIEAYNDARMADEDLTVHGPMQLIEVP